MSERNVIGATTATILTPFVEGWPKLLPYLIFALVLMLVDFRFGVAASKKRGEAIRKSRAVRRTLNKLVDYICWISIAWLFGASFGKDLGVPAITYVVLAIIYGIELQSIFDNYFDYKGLKKRFSVLKFFAKIFGKPEIAESMEDRNDDLAA